jgi:hypothetical protein
VTAYALGAAAGDGASAQVAVEVSTTGEPSVPTQEAAPAVIVTLPVGAAAPDRAVTDAVTETGASSMKDMGSVMKAAQAKLQGKTVDGKLVSEAVKAKLA